MSSRIATTAPPSRTIRPYPFGRSTWAVKTVADLYARVSVEIAAINEKLNDSPELVNKDAFGEGWMIKIKASDIGELESLMDADGYAKMLES